LVIYLFNLKAIYQLFIGADFCQREKKKFVATVVAIWQLAYFSTLFEYCKYFKIANKIKKGNDFSLIKILSSTKTCFKIV